MIYLLCVLVLVVWYAGFRYKRRRLYELASLIEAPLKEWPFIGIGYAFVGGTDAMMKSIKRITYNTINNKDGLSRIWIGDNLYILGINPEDVEKVLKYCLEKSPEISKFTRGFLGNSSIFAPVSIWRKRRKILAPALSPKLIDSFIGVFSKNSARLTSALTNYVGVGDVDFWPYIAENTIESVCETVMGLNKINQISHKSSFLSFLASIEKNMKIINKRVFQIWLYPDFIFKLQPLYREHEQCNKKIRDFINDLIQKKKSAVKITSPGKSEVDHNSGLDLYQQQSFMDLLISLSGGNQGYTDTELREETTTLIVAGTETSAHTVGYVLLMMARFPVIQERVFQELQNVFGDSDRPLKKGDIVNLKLLDRVVKECLRLYPPVPIISRRIEKEIDLVSGFTLPANSTFAVSVWGIHRHPKLWGSNAEDFDPDRFLPERLKLSHQCCFIPFSFGPRNCVGYQFAMMSIKVTLSSIFRRFRVLEDPKNLNNPAIDVKYDLLLKSCNGYRISLEERNSN